MDITISPASATLQSLGETVRLTTTVKDRDGQTMSDVTVTWASVDESVAIVRSGCGRFTVAGEATQSRNRQAGAGRGLRVLPLVE